MKTAKNDSVKVTRNDLLYKRKTLTKIWEKKPPEQIRRIMYLYKE